MGKYAYNIFKVIVNRWKKKKCKTEVQEKRANHVYTEVRAQKNHIKQHTQTE